jgi:hypothetical protein
VTAARKPTAYFDAACPGRAELGTASSTATLVTNSIEEFRRVPALICENWV